MRCLHRHEGRGGPREEGPRRARATVVAAAWALLSLLTIASPRPTDAAHSELAPVTDLFIDSIPFDEFAANSTLSAAIMKGSTLNVTFTVMSSRFSASNLSSIPVASVWDQSSSTTVTVQRPDGSTYDAETPDLHYAGSLDDGSASMTATLYDDGIHMVIFNATSGRLFQVDPVSHISNAFSKDELSLIDGATHVSFVPSTSNMGEPIRTKLDPVTGEMRPSAANGTGANITGGTDHLHLRRRSTVDVAIPSVGYAPLWDDCFPNILQNHTARIAFFVTYGTFLQLDGANATFPVKTLAKLGQLVTDMNIIYEHQLRITVQVHTGKTRIMMAPHTDASANYTWNYGPGYCSTWNNEALGALQSYISTQPKDTSVTSYFLVTVCSSAGGEAGNAYQPGACYSYNTGSIVYGSGLWLTASHEFGHNLNASHAFELGQGKTGGVMDYSDGRYPIGSGYYGFHPVYNKPEICPYLSGIQGTACLPLSINVATSTCGNGIIEETEDCDPGPGRSSPCCSSSCKFVKQCDYMAADSGNAACCTTDCMFASPSTVCGKQSMCRDGVCQGVTCNLYSNLNACSLGECSFGCSYDGSTNNCLPGSQWGWGSLTAPNGTHCGSSSTGICSAGVCTAALGSQSVCGNGIIEPGEACDPPSTCCTSTCTFAPASTVCGKQSMCRNGACQSVQCSWYSNINACSLGDCSFGCWYDGDSSEYCHTGGAFGWGALNAPDGTHCGSGTAAVCTSGVCATPAAVAAASTITSSTKTTSSSPKPTTTPTSTPFPTPTTSTSSHSSSPTTSSNSPTTTSPSPSPTTSSKSPSPSPTTSSKSPSPSPSTSSKSPTTSSSPAPTTSSKSPSPSPTTTSHSTTTSSPAPTSSPVCGNGKVEAGESCDPPGACCNKDCTFSSPSTVCGKQSMCRDGACVGVQCNWYSNINACSLSECAYGCWYDGDSSKYCHAGGAFGWGSLTAPDGTHCGTTGTGACAAGVCTVKAGAAGTAAPVCGNGVIETGEACDPPSACCTSACAFAPPSVACGGSQSYCSNGACVASSCAQYSNLRWCARLATASTNGCTYGCDFGSGTCYDPTTLSGFAAGSGFAANGAFCATGKMVSHRLLLEE
ncbi:hypothetical protein DFJ73DRAFT_956865 [Zopfochytrium polystomum]|nr:hypothetical protein DFJ73DRAFT_956865 [Zopfochytrium polystomum]